MAPRPRQSDTERAPGALAAKAGALPADARRLGVAAGAGVAVLGLAYLGVLAAGLAALPSPAHPIQPPWFYLMEWLILGIAPAMVILSVALHAWAPADRKAFALAGVAFMGLSAALTCVVHFAILTLSRQPAFAGEPWAGRVFSFAWPSVAYALDILAWDFFFALGAGFMAAAVPGHGLARRARHLLLGSAALALLGLVGVALADMQVRNVGIVGYAVLFPIAAGVLAVLFHRTGPVA